MNPIPFGSLASGEPVEAHTLANAAGASAQVLTYGGIVNSLRMPDRLGRMGDVVLGFGSIEAYVGGTAYVGAIAGRVAGRVTGGRICLAGGSVGLECNDGANHLHGGRRGLDRRIWRAEPRTLADGSSSLTLTYTSPDGEEGYPGTVEIAVTYTLTSGNALVVESEVTADRETPLSLAQHSYFNLAGEGSGDIRGHELMVLADDHVPAGAGMTLSDRRVPVAGRGADFRRPRRIGEALPSLFKAHGDLYLLRAGGAGRPESPALAARVMERSSGRVLEVFTDEDCLQFYTGAFLGGAAAGKSGLPYGPYDGLCLECHGYPNATCAAGFGDILVTPGRPQHRRTVYAFSTS
jgi:aldose 1-epimerase